VYGILAGLHCTQRVHVAGLHCIESEPLRACLRGLQKHPGEKLRQQYRTVVVGRHSPTEGLCGMLKSKLCSLHAGDELTG
jgi:hypothetical protein